MSLSKPISIVHVLYNRRGRSLVEQHEKIGETCCIVEATAWLNRLRSEGIDAYVGSRSFW